MKKIKNCFLYCCLLVAISDHVTAQSGPLSAGGDGSGSGGHFSYSIGQVDYVFASGSGGKAFEGLQVPVEVTVGIEDVNIHLHASIYPNPSSTEVILDIENLDLSDMNYILIDLEGKVMQQNKIFSNHTTISLHELAAGNYLLNVQKNNQQKQSFKLTKNN